MEFPAERHTVGRAVERVVRESHGRLLAFLAARSQDVAAAEDALADALTAALEHWPKTGVPINPEAWLLTAARRRLMDAARHERVAAAATPALLAAADEAESLADAEAIFPDERIKLLFICAHPSIDAGVRTPLMLQTVLGLDAARIASAFLVKPSAMGQRLSRAKAKIRDARIPFDVPDAAELPKRLDAVLEAIYAAYGSGWDDIVGGDSRRKGLALEAISLGRLLVELLPGEPEAQGLLAFMLHCEARRHARRASTGAYVPLSEQDMNRWTISLIEEAEQLLRAAGCAGRSGRFQLEAAIQSAHAHRRVTGRTDWNVIALLYEGLVRLAPTVGAAVGRAAAVANARNAATGVQLLEVIPVASVATYQPYWALAAHLLVQLNRIDEARAAYARALGLTEDPALREFLIRRAESVSPPMSTSKDIARGETGADQ